MMSRWRQPACVMSVIAIAGALIAFPSHARAAATYVVGVDNAAPAGHNFEYTSFFPSSGYSVAPGDVVDFKWNQGTLDGFHTATIIKQGDTPQGVYANTPIVVPDGDDGPGTLQQNPAMLAPSNPSCGNSAANPCAYDGTAQLNSGAAPTGPPNDYFATINVPAGTTVNFLCLTHPGMVGSFTVAAQGTPPSSVAAQAATQYVAQTASALRAEAAANSAGVTTNADGTHTYTMTAGVGVPGVEVDEMLPNNVHIAAGDKVKWTTTTINDIHTVTFPNSPAAGAVDPLFPPICEAGPPDTPANGPPPSFGCANPGLVEFPFVPQPQGTSVISTPSTVGTSGVIATAPTPFPTNYTFSFPNAGTYSFVCLVHSHMTGTVSAAKAPAYSMAASDGGFFPFGQAPGGLGSLGGTRLNKPVVGMANTPDGGGYWMVASDGGIFPFGDAGGFGSTGNIRLNQPIVGMAPTPDGGGYWLVAADGGIFPFGDAGGFGSTGNIRLNKPIVGMASTPDGNGYWLVASDGGIFPFGDAGGFGSTGNIRLNKPIVGMAGTVSGRGYWLVASDGGIFPFGDAGGFGSTGNIRLNQPIVALAPTVHGDGYWLIASDGGVFPFGNASGLGSLGNIKLNKPIVGAAGV
jgi:plastocyanin